MLKVICGIGSRATPDDILEEMTKIGTWCCASKIYVRSGHADGADFAFEQGAQSYCIAYLPWRGFMNIHKSQAKMVVPEFNEAQMATVDKFHPAADRLDACSRKMMARNSCQVLGQKLDSPVSAVICWTEKARLVGGTAQAIRIAKEYHIPVWNMFWDRYNTADKVIIKLIALGALK